MKAGSRGSKSSKSLVVLKENIFRAYESISSTTGAFASISFILKKFSS
jgi:hypothetical protein